MVKLQYDNKKKKWIQLEAHSPNGIYLDGFLRKKLDNCKALAKKGFDNIIVIDGARRGGKSTLGMTIAYYLYPKLSINNFISGMKEAVTKIDSLPDGSVAFFDESSLVFHSKDAMNREQKKLLKIIDIIGQKRMYMIVILPSFFDLIRPIATTHSRFLLHIYTDKQLNRGRFAYFGTRGKRILYMLGKKNFGSYLKPEADFIGRFLEYKPSFYDEYIKLKNRSLREALGDKHYYDIDKEGKRAFTMISLKNSLSIDPSIKTSQLATLFGISTRSIQLYIREIRTNQRNEGSKI